MRKTKSVKKVLDAFSDTNDAVSVVDLVKAFQKDMNKTTVYRILDRLEAEGILHSFTGKQGLKWYAKFMDEQTNDSIHYHPHFQCQDCGKSECLPLEIAIPKLPNYQISSANLILTGHCQDCLG